MVAHIKPDYTIVYSRSVDPRKLCIGVKYYIVHMYSMPYYTYGITANFLFLEPTVLIYIYIKRTVNNSSSVPVDNSSSEVLGSGLVGSVFPLQLKGLLDGLREKLVPTIEQCAKRGLCSAQFLAYMTSDLRSMEEVARVKVSQ